MSALAQCDNCGMEYPPVACRWRCPACGWKDTCCDVEPQRSSCPTPLSMTKGWTPEGEYMEMADAISHKYIE